MQRQKKSFRGWLVALNVAILAVPAVAAAHSPAGVAGQIAAGCCARMMVSAAINSATSSNTSRPAEIQYVSAEGAWTQLEHRCVVENDAMDCWSLAAELDRPAADRATREKALMYYRRACSLRPDTRSCELGEKLAGELGCADTPDNCAWEEFDASAASSAFADAETEVARRCENDAALVNEVVVSLTFGPSGEAMSIGLEPSLEGMSIGDCIEDVFLSLSVPLFSGDGMTVKKTISLAGVASGHRLLKQ